MSDSRPKHEPRLHGRGEARPSSSGAEGASGLRPGGSGPQAGRLHGGGAIHVTVCYAEPRRAWEWALALPPGATVADALAASGYGQAFSGQDPYAAGVGVFGVRRDSGHVLSHGDRVEIYRPLVFDPKESRRRRAAHKARSAGS